MRLAALRTAAVKMMTEEHVAAIITPSRDGGDGGGTGIIFDDNGANIARSAQIKANAVTIPNAVMMIEHYNRLGRLLQNHVPVTLEVNIETKFTGDNEHGFDTVAEIPGTDPKLKDQVVMVGGHLDSWISGTGATDNGAGSIMAMEAVRILKALNIKPKRTIRIALWSGEEQGLCGSRGYVHNHFGGPEGAPLPVCGAAAGAARSGPSARSLPSRPPKSGRPSTPTTTSTTAPAKSAASTPRRTTLSLPIFRQWIAPLADLGVTAISYRNTGGTDHLSFDAVGLPGFQYIQDPMDYETRTHHSDMDTFDRLHALDLEQGAVLEAIFLYNTSEREAMMPRKPFPRPELDREKSAPIPGIFPNATGAPEEPAVPGRRRQQQ